MLNDVLNKRILYLMAQQMVIIVSVMILVIVTIFNIVLCFWLYNELFGHSVWPLILLLVTTCIGLAYHFALSAYNSEQVLQRRISENLKRGLV